MKTYETTIEACKESVRKLGVDKIDLYLVHTPFSGKEARIEQWRALVECQRLGLCKSIGVSNYGIKHLQELTEAGLPTPSANQLELHPLCQKKELLEFMKANGKILPIAYSSLAPLSEWRDGYTAMAGSKDESAKADGTPSLVSEVASKHGASPHRGCSFDTPCKRAGAYCQRACERSGSRRTLTCRLRLAWRRWSGWMGWRRARRWRLEARGSRWIRRWRRSLRNGRHL